MTNLDGQVALITGSAHGIGLAIAQRYASLGANVVINYASNEARALEAVAATEQAGRPSPSRPTWRR